jgi:hypothetical protein
MAQLGESPHLSTPGPAKCAGRADSYREAASQREVPGRTANAAGLTLGNLSKTALVALFDEHWEALAQAPAGSPRYIELGSAGIIADTGGCWAALPARSPAPESSRWWALSATLPAAGFGENPVSLLQPCLSALDGTNTRGVGCVAWQSRPAPFRLGRCDPRNSGGVARLGRPRDRGPPPAPHPCPQLADGCPPQSPQSGPR